MRGKLVAIAALTAAVLGPGLEGCTELVDGHVNVDLIYPCRPSESDLGARMALFCLSVEQGGGVVSGPSCASSLDATRLELPESLTPLQVRVEIFDASGVLLLRGASPAVSMISGEDVQVPVALAPGQEFGLIFADEAGCQPLPFDLEGHTASLFPSGHVLLSGSGRPEVSSDRAAALLDTCAPGATVLPTPVSLHRHQHEASLLDDGRLLLLGGLTTRDGLATSEVISLAGSSALMGGYEPGLSYAGSLLLEALPGLLLHGRPRPHAAVFFGSQVMLTDAESPPEMRLDSGARSAPMEFPGQPVPPLQPDGHTPGVAPYSADKALVPGLGVGRLGRLTVQQGTASAVFEVVADGMAARDAPLTLLLPGGAVMVLGGLLPSAVGEPPVIVIDQGGAWTPVPVPAGFPGRGFSATLLTGGRVAVIGGVDLDTGVASRRTFFILPTAGGGYRVAPGPDLRLARALHTSTWLPDGRLLVIGGTSLGAGPDPARSAEALAIATP